MTPSKNTSRKEILIAIVCFTLVISLLFSKYINEPATLFPAAGDGMKNYFTFLYHAKYDSTYWKFEGMNYPFGENIVFTDNQPILVNSVKLLSNYITLSSENLIAIHNFTILLGLILGGLGLFLCFRKLNVDFIIALLVSLGLIILQPQIIRFQSHYSMVYPFLPWIFYFWIKIWQNHNYLKSSIFISILTIIGGMLHMYHFVTIAFLSIMAIFLTYFLTKNKSHWTKGYVALTIQVIIPLIILQLIAGIHYVEGRPDNPWGFFNYHATWETLFFSYKLPLFEFINQNLIKIRSFDHNEGKNYIGLISVAITLYGLFLFFTKYKSSKQVLFNTESIHSKLIWLFLGSALISFGLPFVIPGMEWALDYTGPFKQFRTIGRMAWISFYAINLISIPWIFARINLLSKPKRVLISGIIILIIGIEGFMMLPDMNNPDHLKNSFSSYRLLIPINTSEYQAILPDPYLHIGSECFGWEDLGGNQDQNFQITYQLGLPNMAVVMSRNALYQALMLNELVCKPYRVPKIIEIIKKKDSRPLLVLQSKLELYTKRSSIEHWVNQSPIVYETNDYRLRRMELNQFDSIVNQFNDSISHLPNLNLERPINLDLMKKDKKWGFETIIYSDSSMVGSHIISFNIKIKNNRDVSTIVDTWQINTDHELLEYRSERINKYYTKIFDDIMTINIPINLDVKSGKLCIRISKEKQTLSDNLELSDVKLIKTIQ